MKRIETAMAWAGYSVVYLGLLVMLLSLFLLDTWTTQSPSGNTVTFTIKGRKELGFEYSAEAVGRKIVKVRIRRKILTRAEVEKLFAEYIAKS